MEDEGEESRTDPLLKAVGERITEIRAAKGLKTADLAKAAGVSPAYMWRVEAGRQNLSLRSLSRLALALGIPMASLLKGIDADPATIGTRPYVWKEGTESGKDAD